MEEQREARGVHNPKVVDLIRLDSERGEVVLLMLEQRPWGSTPDQLRQLEAKFNGYLCVRARWLPRRAVSAVQRQADLHPSRLCHAAW